MPTAVSDVDVLILCGGLGTRLRSTIGEAQKVATDTVEPIKAGAAKAFKSVA